MSKRWLLITRASVFGLCLGLLGTVSANAASLRQGNHQANVTMMFGGPASDVESSAVPNTVPLPVQEFSAGGVGILNFIAPAGSCAAAGLVCNSGDFCQCAELIGSITDGQGPFSGGINIDLLLSVNLSTLYNDGNNVGRVCFFATGALSLNPAVFPANHLNIETAGAACNAAGTGVALYSGGFIIGASTGGFSNASGGGMLGFGAVRPSDVTTFDIRGAGSNLN